MKNRIDLHALQVNIHPLPSSPLEQKPPKFAMNNGVWSNDQEPLGAICLKYVNARENARLLKLT